VIRPAAANRPLDALVWLVGRAGLAPLLIVLLVVLFGLLEPRFFNRLNLINVLRNSSFLMIAATGQMLVLIVGGFDLSVGAVAALASVVAASAMTALLVGMPDATLAVIAGGVLAGLAAGAAIGLLNGACVAFLKVSPFIDQRHRPRRLQKLSPP
jgi:ribose transport system permease protein